MESTAQQVVGIVGRAAQARSERIGKPCWTEAPRGGTCEKCGAPTEAQRIPWSDDENPKWWTPSICGKPWNPGDEDVIGCLGKHDKEEVEKRERALEGEREIARLALAGVPRSRQIALGPHPLREELRRFWRPERWIEQRNLTREFPAPWFGLLMGDTGTGKSTQLVRAARYYMRKGWSARYVSEEDLLDGLRPSREGIEAFKHIDLLCIDEWGADGELSHWATKTLFLILGERWEQGRPTLLATNHSPEDLEANPSIGKRMMSRVMQACREGHEQSTWLVLAENFRRRAW